jgi:hypothetical protein
VAATSPAPAHVVSRIAAALLGGYAFVWGFTTLLIAAGMTLGARYGDAQTTAYLLAFVVFLIAFLWAFAARSVLRVWALLAGGGAVMTAIAWWLAPGAG